MYAARFHRLHSLSGLSIGTMPKGAPCLYLELPPVQRPERDLPNFAFKIKEDAVRTPQAEGTGDTYFSAAFRCPRTTRKRCRIKGHCLRFSPMYILLNTFAKASIMFCAQQLVSIAFHTEVVLLDWSSCPRFRATGGLSLRYSC